MSDFVTLTIDGKEVKAPVGSTVLEAAKLAGIHIPTLCYLKGVNEIGACRMCVVDVGAKSLQAACMYPVAEGLKVVTNSPEIRESRRVTLELILSSHEKKCLSCVRSRNCELQKLARDLNIQDIRFEGAEQNFPIDDLSHSIVRDPNKCILCRRCVSVCKYIQTVSAIETVDRGYKTIVASPFHMPLRDTPCVNCGQCIVACPTGALREKSSIEKVWDALGNEDLYVIVQTAPAVRAALGEEFGLPIGTPVTGKMVSALKKLKFDKVFDTDTAADLTIMEEGTELVNRIKNNGKLPLITSCSPGWIKFCEHNFPDMLDNLSTCKSPHEMFGAMLKSYYAEKMGIDPSKIFVVSVMPCTAKKFESKRSELASTGYPDVDEVITTRELAEMIKEAGIDFVNLEDEKFDDPMGEATGAGVIFGATGGVMEAALRSVPYLLTGKDPEQVEIKAVRGEDGIKTAELEVAGIKIRAAVAHGLGNARKLLEKVRSGEETYHFIEIMACPGGCVTGGGQPIQPASVRNEIDLRTERAKAIYQEDESSTMRFSHHNPTVQKFYEEYLGEPGGHKSHELLHTHYIVRENYPEDCVCDPQ
ncbi:MAG TPA: NADH-dependent [FeFe] hydrogenase, group A6 [Thermoclostridium sp.]|nr:2Fe-2S iron-sulfur cluster binding domain-containing protein [Clostridiaceae bacterium]HOQ75106.1 NADH-dependent [FeFe] hydrogenase, group A6 [Thermoclostridium sp.]HPU45757.1 NADH-dependent [FeFe] hydrogenase, group A6 [Thermoclostridium sp.]